MNSGALFSVGVSARGKAASNAAKKVLQVLSVTLAVFRSPAPRSQTSQGTIGRDLRPVRRRNSGAMVTVVDVARGVTRA